MTVPTGFALSGERHFVVDTAGADKFGVQLCMATDAVVHDDSRAAVECLDGLWLAAHSEDRRVAQAVHAFEKPFPGKTLVGYVAIVTGSVAAMRTVVPGGIVGSHDMAIHTARRIIRQVTPGSGGKDGIGSETTHDSRCYDSEQPHPPRGKYHVDYFSYFHTALIIV